MRDLKDLISDTTFPEKRMQGLQNFVHFTKKHNTPFFENDSDAPQKLDQNVRVVTRRFLIEHEDVFNQLISCYQKVFGGQDMWKEGAQCEQCRSYVSIEDFASLKACPRCNGKLNECFPAQVMKEKIMEELSGPSVCILLFNDTQEIIGFAWGLIDTLQNTLARILHWKYKDRIEEGSLILEEFKKRLLFQGYTQEDKVFYTTEIGLLKEYRTGLTQLIRLSRHLVNYPVNNCAKIFITYTSGVTPMYTIFRLIGYIKALTDITEDNPIHFIFWERDEFVSCLKCLQNYPVRIVEALLTEGFIDLKIKNKNVLRKMWELYKKVRPTSVLLFIGKFLRKIQNK